MGLVVQKYGGSSVATAERIKNVAARIRRARESGDEVVAVISAMGKTTDELIRLARTVSSEPDARELDLLLSTGETVSCTLMAMALRDQGCPAISLTGPQAGIKTDSIYSRARIREVDSARVRRELSEGKVVIVTGFQGQADTDDVTTLGRGGSDTSAVALACALGAPRCEIYTDVDGIYTADPRICPSARRLDVIGYEEMLEMAQLGAKVMHPRSVELGEVYGVPIVVLSSFGDGPGTVIRKLNPEDLTMEHRNRVRGIAHDTNVAKVSITGVPDKPGIAAALFAPLAEAAINVDVIVQTAAVDGITDLAFTVARDDLAKAMRLMASAVREAGARQVITSDDLGKVSIVGVGVQSAPGMAQRMFARLAKAQINIHMISTSEIRVTAIVPRDRVTDAVEALHAEFGLDKE